MLPDAKSPLYNLENTLRNLSQLDNSYVIGIFDCCREAFNEAMFKKVAMRGGSDNENETVLEKG